MSDIEQKRDFILGISPTPGWRKKVLSMSDAQVVAIYLREHNKPPKTQEPNHDEGNDDDEIPF